MNSNSSDLIGLGPSHSLLRAGRSWFMISQDYLCTIALPASAGQNDILLGTIFCVGSMLELFSGAKVQDMQLLDMTV